MIRIITARDESLTPTAWDDYPQVQLDQVPALLGIRFERELVELAAAGIDLGVRRWREVTFRVSRFAAAAEAAQRERRRNRRPETEFEDWLAAHPDFLLTEQVGIWAAVNCGGGSLSLLQVLQLAPRDVVEAAELADFLPDEAPEAEAAGKA